MPDEKPRQTSLRLPDYLLDALDDEARKRGWSRTALVEQIAAKFVQAHGHRVRLHIVI